MYVENLIRLITGCCSANACCASASCVLDRQVENAIKVQVIKIKKSESLSVTLHADYYTLLVLRWFSSFSQLYTAYIRMVKNDMLVNKNANIKMGEYVQRRACTRVWLPSGEKNPLKVSFWLTQLASYRAILAVCQTVTVFAS